MLIEIGYKEIDVSFPSASQTEFDFTRKIVETPGAVPDDLWLQVLSPCRKELIRRTVDSVAGCKKAIISLYIAASDSFQKTIFDASQDEVLELAVDCVKYTRSITKDDPCQRLTEWNLMFSPEAFSDTDVEYSLRLCEAVKAVWEPSTENPIILNLPATVEMSTPNTFADQVEIFSNGILEREKVCVSLHPHNDRGCAVAAAELAQMAGADRVEGCLFGNGERTGNVDLVTLALNLYTQGVDPKIDFSNLKSIRETVERCTQIPVHDRAPYSGDYVFRAYSGSHQDAINKGFKNNSSIPNNCKRVWKVPYLPLDPQDIGLTYESVILLNSQSGKGGIAWALQRTLSLELPRQFQLAFSKVMKASSDSKDCMLKPFDVAKLFLGTYHVLSQDPHVVSANYSLAPNKDQGKCKPYNIEATVITDGDTRHLSGSGKDVLSAVQHALSASHGEQPILFESHQRTLLLDNRAPHRIVMVECHSPSLGRRSWGASILEDSDMAELQASLSSAL